MDTGAVWGMSANERGSGAPHPRMCWASMTLEAVADAAGVCPRTVRKWVDR
jgi:uncharacterized protein YjcR